MSDKNQLRDLVFREIVRTANENPGFKAVVEPLGFFTFMALLDGIVDAVVSAQESLSPGSAVTANRHGERCLDGLPIGDGMAFECPGSCLTDDGAGQEKP